MVEASSKDIFYDPFIPSAFLEKLAFVPENSLRQGDLSVSTVKHLRNVFVNKCEELKSLSLSIEGEISSLKSSISGYQDDYSSKIQKNDGKIKRCFRNFKSISRNVSDISERVTEVRTQLQSVSIPLSRVSQSIEILSIFNAFMVSDKVPFSYQDSASLFNTTKVMHQVVSMAEDLLQPRFQKAKERLSATHLDLIQKVVTVFKNGYKSGNIEEMRNAADTLLPSKGFQLCWMTLIDLCLEDFVECGDVFTNLFTSIETCGTLALQVFPSSSRLVVSNMVQKAYEVNLKEHISSSLNKCKNMTDYLKSLKYLVQRSLEMEEKMSEKGIDAHISYVKMQRETVFNLYTAKYIDDELTHLKDTYQNHLNTLTEEQLKKSGGGGSLNFLNFKSNTFTSLSLDVAMTMIQENREAIERCEVLSTQLELAKNVNNIFNVLVDFLLRIYCSSYLDSALKNLPPNNPKQSPSLEFFNSIEAVSTVVLLMENHLAEYIIDYIKSTTYYSPCVSYVRKMKASFETKMDEGLDRLLVSYINFLRNVLAFKQKPSDFMTESVNIIPSEACVAVCENIDVLLSMIKTQIAGKNSNIILNEFSLRFVRLLIDHICGFSISCAGGMNLMCDIKEYHKCLLKYNIQVVKQLFEILFSVIDFLVVAPNHVKELISNDDLMLVDRELISNIIALRTDSREIKM